MALTTCYECKKDVSTGAKTCPHCGARQPTKPNYGCALALIVVIAGVALLLAVGAVIGPSTPAAAEDSGTACVMAQSFVKDRLKAPATADFPNCFETDGSTATAKGDGFWTSTGYVDAQNGFGAKIRSTYYVKLKYVGADKWHADDVFISGG